MKRLNDYIIDEHIFSPIMGKYQFKPNDPSHKRLLNSFVSWLNGMREKYDDDLILNMIDWAEDDIRLGEI